MYRSSSARRELGMRTGPFTGGAVLLPWDAIDLRTRRKLLAAQPIAAERRRVQTFAMFALACACGFALVLISGYGFGRTGDAWLIERPWLAVPYALLLAGVVVPSAWLARRVLSAGAWFPFARALLQLDALEHTPKGLVVRPFGDARHAVIDNGFVELQYADGSTFRVRTQTPPDAMNVAIGFAEEILTRASLSDDHSLRDAIDPLGALRDDRGFSPRSGTKKLAGERGGRDRSAWMAIPLALALFAAAWPLLAHRNQLSDDAAFAYARHMNTSEPYEAYLASGGTRHAREVNEDLLPRVVLDSAKVRDDADAIGKFLTRFPGSRFDAEARAALLSSCAALGDEYARTSKVDLFEDLRRFERDHPACADQRGAVSARFFDTRRKALRDDGELQPELRDMFITLLDRAERDGAVAAFRVWVRAGNLGSAERFALESGLHALVGPAIAARFTTSAITDGEWIEMMLTGMTCAPGFEPNPGSMQVWFHPWNNPEHVGWWRRVKSGHDLFAALTTREEPKVEALCAPRVMP